MAAPEEGFNPESIEEVLDLLPSKCRPCGFAKMLVGITWAFDTTTSGPLPEIRDIDELCEGHRGDREPELAETITELGGQALLFGIPDADGSCPYRELVE